MVQTVARPLKEAQELVLPATLLTTFIGIAPYTRDKLDQIKPPHQTQTGRKTVLDKEVEITNRTRETVTRQLTRPGPDGSSQDVNQEYLSNGIKTNSFNFLNIESPQNAYSLQNVNGTNLTTYGMVNLEFSLRDAIFRHQFIVCDITPDAILGQDFLLKHVKKIDYRSHILQTENSDIKCWVGGEFRMTCRVLARDTVGVPSNSSITLPVNVPNKEHVTSIAIIEPCNILYEEKNISVVSGIINSNDEYPFVQVVNYSESDVKLYPNTMLGTCESVVALPDFRQDRCAGFNIIPSRQLENDENGVPEHLQDLLTRSGTHLTPIEKTTLAELLNKFQDVFSRSPEDIGRTDKIKHSIDTGDARPVRVPPRRLKLTQNDVQNIEEDNKETAIPQCTPLNQIRAVTRSRQVNSSAELMKIKDLVIDGWDQATLRKSQLDDHEISELLMKIEDKKRPEWNEISNQAAENTSRSSLQEMDHRK
ncbi:unnamed protein product [Mytilus coruscus]|uniref:Uncharacterized protein n=1 Tax=Mytilus coruscus TaxID=42192 RepID=A0A6J8C8V6_MYTCO|nr:unnamed protein product [Mytilus coruscus]